MSALLNRDNIAWVPESFPRVLIEDASAPGLLEALIAPFLSKDALLR